ncbi:hypothetical protein A3715_06070 [Oleiphilus sp. HI0009]|uniref:methyl-accepting chemotaxis protein n=1 Tax=unclassified Oleiphilus TaxID=2631174 RepID=UPI0007C3EFAA|nr:MULTISPECIES: methyl-accepting chemotaxis protein [unclassified Oleiphilus]KZX81966.1 hypothetical protein A3715_34360 [Oleiphilus sp. HI0009]KZX82086.1 hypothetical protein A3715_06070 [Oleiphilus sp. HI0009]KZY70209.1 hypothetical protein A3738_15410 [Oleiphilus sp. HI0066]KZZ58700.1 hypothetical protein A3762_06805 [Oleiphilus sp. HI0125]
MTLFNFFITLNIRQAAKESATTYSDTLAQYIYTGRLDELGSLELSKIFMRNKLETALWRVVDSTKNVEDGARLSANMASDTEQQTARQKQELEQLATAINEMSTSITEVSQNTQNVSSLMQSVQNNVAQGSSQVNATQRNK